LEFVSNFISNLLVSNRFFDKLPKVKNNSKRGTKMLKFSTGFVTAFAIVSLIFSNSIEAKTQTTTRTSVSKKAIKPAAKSKVIAKRSVKKSNIAKAKSSNKSYAMARAMPRKALFAPEKSSFGDLEGLQKTVDPLALQSSVALVIDQESSQVLFEKNASVSLPIASITKLMTSLVVLEANQDMNEILEVTNGDVDYEKNSGSRLRVGSKLSRSDMLHIALMSSENRAASSLGRNYPGGLPGFVAAMNAKARELGMLDTHYVDSTGLSSRNVASAQDLAKLVKAAYAQPLIRQYSTDTKYAVAPGGRMLEYISSNKLTSKPDWEIGLQKTGYISEAGRCLVMQAMIKGRAVVMVFLDSKGKYSRFADAGRIRNWLENTQPTVSKSTF
jgi:D-alanyl-D-alanine endopeptidase (penicillin-binding protein 7)